MTLQQRIKASAQELIRLLEESDKEHQDFIKERDTRLGFDEDTTSEYVLCDAIELNLPPYFKLVVYRDMDTREAIKLDMSPIDDPKDVIGTYSIETAIYDLAQAFIPSYLTQAPFNPDDPAFKKQPASTIKRIVERSGDRAKYKESSPHELTRSKIRNPSSPQAEQEERSRDNGSSMELNEPSAKDYVLAKPMSFTIEQDITVDLFIEEGTRNLVGVDIAYPEGTDLQFAKSLFHDIISQCTGATSLDNGKPFTRKADASEEPRFPILETKIIHLARELSQLLEDHLQALMQARKEKEGSREYTEKMTSLWNRLLDFDAQIITAAFSNRPHSHLKMLAARLAERY